RPRVASTVAAPGSWLVLSDNGGVGTALAKVLTTRGDRCHVVFASKAPRRISAKTRQIDPRRRGDFQRLVRELCTANAPLRGPIYLWALDSPSLDRATSARLEA